MSFDDSVISNCSLHIHLNITFNVAVHNILTRLITVFTGRVRNFIGIQRLFMFNLGRLLSGVNGLRLMAF